MEHRDKVQEIRLPFPPSVNDSTLNRRGGGRALTPAARQWRHDAGWALKEQHPRQHAGRVAIRIHLDDTRQGDADNRVKAVLDLLVAHRVIPDDRKRFVANVVAAWASVEGCVVRIEDVGEVV